MKKLQILALVLGLCTAFGVQNAQADPQMAGDCQGPMQGPCGQGGGHGYHHGFGGPCPGPFFTEDKELTAEQRDKYAALLREFEPKVREIRNQLYVKTHVLDALEHAVQPDVAQIEATAKEIIALKNARRELRTQFEDRAVKECGLKRFPRPLPGLDMPHRGGMGHGPHHGGPDHGGPHQGPHHMMHE